ncbi:uncharacterized protein LOC105786950 [Gossypium raimondii]|uniref:uncharacterized protein LOC105786950 n=1 Tax=Gossypium raimondii TaxID=29730 RepID=UPI00063AC691|nr:uncharacterized protein LOC105786950 [Gossypium raimondii]
MGRNRSIRSRLGKQLNNPKAPIHEEEKSTKVVDKPLGETTPEGPIEEMVEPIAKLVEIFFPHLVTELCKRAKATVGCSGRVLQPTTNPIKQPSVEHHGKDRKRKRDKPSKQNQEVGPIYEDHAKKNDLRVPQFSAIKYQGKDKTSKNEEEEDPEEEVEDPEEVEEDLEEKEKGSEDEEGSEEEEEATECDSQEEKDDYEATF